MQFKRLFKFRNIYINRICSIVLVVIMSITFESYFVGCGTKNKNIENIKISKEVSNKNLNEVIKEIKESQIACFTEIVYASKDKVILYGPIGLIVYDIANKQIYRAIDLKSINMNHVQGDIVTMFQVNKDENKILMYNDYGEDKNAYLYDIENDTLEKTNTKKFTTDYNTTNYFEFEKYDEWAKKYDDMEIGSNWVQIDDSNICYLIYPKKLEGSRGLAGMQIVILNKGTNQEKRYSVFS